MHHLIDEKPYSRLHLELNAITSPQLKSNEANFAVESNRIKVIRPSHHHHDHQNMCAVVRSARRKQKLTHFLTPGRLVIVCCLMDRQTRQSVGQSQWSSAPALNYREGKTNNQQPVTVGLVRCFPRYTQTKEYHRNKLARTMLCWSFKMPQQFDEDTLWAFQVCSSPLLWYC